MKRLASPISDLKDFYDVVVVGSGYGGAVAAARVAAARDSSGGVGPTVCILERGLEYQPGEYPDTLWSAFRNSQLEARFGHWGSRAGLYDFRVFRDVSVFKGCGLGGTSLVNAGVVVRPNLAILHAPAWPDEIRKGDLAPWFERAHTMLKPARYPRPLWPASDAPLEWPELPKLTALRDAALPGTQAELAEIAVSFKTRLNEEGVFERACTLCGDCVSGCNFAAKKTLIMNYLPHAKNNGAQIFCGIEVWSLQRRHWKAFGRDVWLVHFRVVSSTGAQPRWAESFVAADTVVLGAGSLGSPEILLRSRSKGLLLSQRLGEQFTGNGDVIAFCYNSTRETRGVGLGHRAPGRLDLVGPTIAGTIDLRPPRLGDILVQEGVIPSALVLLARLVMPVSAFFTGSEVERGIGEVVRGWGRGLLSLLGGAYRGALQRTQTLLVIGHDTDAGRMELLGDRLRIRWPMAGYQATLSRARAYLRELAYRLGGRHVLSPFWSRVTGNRLITVHPLGGCVMANEAKDGVVNHAGQVFSGLFGRQVHDGLYVCDGSVIPLSLGANPLLTISALAERSADILVRQRGWIPEQLPVPGNHKPPKPTAQEPPAVGLRFTERMRGWFTRVGDAKASTLEFFVVTTSDNLKQLIQDSEHPASMVGVARAPSLSPDQLAISGGRFNLFEVDPSRVETRLMRYRMFLTTTDGARYYFDGAKVIHDEPLRADLWKDLTTLPFTIQEENDGGPVVGRGQVRLSRLDVVRIAFSARITGATSLMERWSARLQFIAFYATVLYKQFGWPFGPVDLLNPYRRKLSKPQVPEKEDEAITLVTQDNADIHLTRFQGGLLGPVILAPGYGTSSYAFRLPTQGQNITTFLKERGYDVWLLDYRGSERSAASATQFTVDHIARYDIPAAASRVRQATGRRPQIVAHCLASASVHMSLLGGWLFDPDGTLMVRSVVGSQFFTHIDQGWVNRLRATLPVAELMWLTGYWPRPAYIAHHTLDPDLDTWSPFLPRVWDRLLHFYPTLERCRNPVCRRAIMLYGDNFRHDQINAETHDAVYDMFNRTNARIFKQLGKMLRHARLVDANGHDRYLRPENARRLRLPMSLIQCTGNRFFRWPGAARSLAWLRSHAPADFRACSDEKKHPYQVRYIPDYGHMDTFIGRDAARDVFPIIQWELERGDRALKEWKLNVPADRL